MIFSNLYLNFDVMSVCKLFLFDFYSFDEIFFFAEIFHEVRSNGFRQLLKHNNLTNFLKHSFPMKIWTPFQLAKIWTGPDSGKAKSRSKELELVIGHLFFV